MRLKWSKSLDNRKKIMRHNFQKLVFVLAKNLYFVIIAFKNIKDGIQIQIHNINNEIANHFGLFILVEVKKNLRKSQAQFREKIRKLRVRQNYGFLIKKTCIKKKLPLPLNHAHELLLCHALLVHQLNLMLILSFVSSFHSHAHLTFAFFLVVLLLHS